MQRFIALAAARMFKLENWPKSLVEMCQQIEFSVDRRKIEPIICCFALPAVFQNKSVNPPVAPLYDGIAPNPQSLRLNKTETATAFRRSFGTKSQAIVVSIRSNLEMISRQSDNSWICSSFPTHRKGAEA